METTKDIPVPATAITTNNPRFIITLIAMVMQIIITGGNIS